MRAVEAAQADGRWEAAYDSARTAAVPDDLQAALDADPAAREFFATLNAANRYAVLWRIQTARTPETRAKRIQQLVDGSRAASCSIRDTPRKGIIPGNNAHLSPDIV